VLPFQLSAKVKFWNAEVPGICPRNQPTAMQSFAAGHETELRLALITCWEAEAAAGVASARGAASARGVSIRCAKRRAFTVTAVLPLKASAYLRPITVGQPWPVQGSGGLGPIFT
jgi:hypothetical protein